MKLREAILLSLSVGFLIIGIHQVMINGFGKAYWAIMLSLVLFFSHVFLKTRRRENDQDSHLKGDKSGPKDKRTAKSGKRRQTLNS